MVYVCNSSVIDSATQTLLLINFGALIIDSIPKQVLESSKLRHAGRKQNGLVSEHSKSQHSANLKCSENCPCYLSSNSYIINKGGTIYNTFVIVRE